MDSNETRCTHAGPTGSESYLWPPLSRKIQALQTTDDRRAFDLGCGNGFIAGMLCGLGIYVTGVDTSDIGIVQSTASYPRCRFEVASAYDDLTGRYGRFQLVVILEVVGNSYDPRRYVRPRLTRRQDNGVDPL